MREEKIILDSKLFFRYPRNRWFLFSAFFSRIKLYTSAFPIEGDLDCYSGRLPRTKIKVDCSKKGGEGWKSGLLRCQMDGSNPERRGGVGRQIEEPKAERRGWGGAPDGRAKP